MNPKNKSAMLFPRVEVFANNKEGASPPTRLKVAPSRVKFLEASVPRRTDLSLIQDPVKAENPYTAPGVPTDVNIVDFDEQSVTLRWCKVQSGEILQQSKSLFFQPTSDGGRPISHYIIQVKMVETIGVKYMI